MTTNYFRARTKGEPRFFDGRSLTATFAAYELALMDAGGKVERVCVWHPCEAIPSATPIGAIWDKR